jgi:hypothetical protein
MERTALFPILVYFEYRQRYSCEKPALVYTRTDIFLVSAVNIRVELVVIVVIGVKVQ